MPSESLKRETTAIPNRYESLLCDGRIKTPKRKLEITSEPLEDATKDFQLDDDVVA